MRKYLMQFVAILTALPLSVSVLAHGDHVMVTPSHGIEHIAYYGAGVMATLLLVHLGRKILKQVTNK